jgi:predicted PurR-regulated permease PerM
MNVTLLSIACLAAIFLADLDRRSAARGGNFITLVKRRIAMLPPWLTLAVQLFLGMVAGWLGIALAAPLAVACVSVASSLLRDEQTKDGVQSQSPNSARLL